MILDYIRCLKCDRPVSPIKFDFRDVLVSHVKACVTCKYDEEPLFDIIESKPIKAKLLSHKPKKRKWSK